MIEYERTRPKGWRCPYDAGFDPELGPIGCDLEGADGGCVCQDRLSFEKNRTHISPILETAMMLRRVRETFPRDMPPDTWKSRVNDLLFDLENLDFGEIK